MRDCDNEFKLGTISIQIITKYYKLINMHEFTNNLNASEVPNTDVEHALMTSYQCEFMEVMNY